VSAALPPPTHHRRIKTRRSASPSDKPATAGSIGACSSRGRNGRILRQCRQGRNAAQCGADTGDRDRFLVTDTIMRRPAAADRPIRGRWICAGRGRDTGIQDERAGAIATTPDAAAAASTPFPFAAPGGTALNAHGRTTRNCRAKAPRHSPARCVGAAGSAPARACPHARRSRCRGRSRSGATGHGARSRRR